MPINIQGNDFNNMLNRDSFVIVDVNMFIIRVFVSKLSMLGDIIFNLQRTPLILENDPFFHDKGDIFSLTGKDRNIG